jgi:hypothetical protein
MNAVPMSAADLQYRLLEARMLHGGQKFQHVELDTVVYRDAAHKPTETDYHARKQSEGFPDVYSR